MSDRATIEEVQKLVRLMREAGVKDSPSKAVIELLESGADVIDRLQREVNSTLGLFYQESERRAEAERRLSRLVEERDQFVEQLAIRSESGMAKDMQEVMRINNGLATENKRLENELRLWKEQG